MSELPKEILTIEEACALLGISAKTFAKILREDDIPGRKIGREWKFSRQALIDWVGSAKAKDFIHTGRRKQGNRQVEKAPEPANDYDKGPARPRRREDTFSIEED